MTAPPGAPNTYTATVKGEATYHFTLEQPVLGGSLSTVDDLTFRFEAKMPKFQLLGGRGIGQAKLTGVQAKRHLQMPDPLDGVATGDCAGTEATVGSASLDTHHAAVRKRKEARLSLVPFRVVEAPFTCKVIEPFNRRSARCPAPVQDHKTACEFRMKGTLTLRRTGKRSLLP